MCTDLKLISNTTVERSRDKLLGLYSNIQPFYTKYKKFTTSLNGMSRILNLSVLHTQVPNISGDITSISFLFQQLQPTETRKSRNTRFENPLGSEKGRGAVYLELKEGIKSSK